MEKEISSFIRFKYTSAFFVFLVTLVLTSSVFVSYKAREAAGKEILNAHDVIRTLRMHGIVLKPESSLNPEDYKIEDTEPTIYMDSRGNQLLIYTLRSFVERQQKFNEFELLDKLSLALQDKTYYSKLYKVKNLQLIYIIAYPFKEKHQVVNDYMMKISKVIFKDLNDGKEIVFTGESASWEAKVTVKYYEHWWTDDSENKVHHESYHTKNPTITYKGQIPEHPVSLEYSFSTRGNKLSGTRDEITPEELIKGPHLGSGGGNGYIPLENDVYEVKVTLDGKTEEFDATIRNTSQFSK
ncbi:hypothetical protein [Desulfosporosinus nitroreducens]|uniref:Uncharacterized protein n=1 Tax=Desulfosporosinus nitroreducens TaxID=2018668 RepID=A0ABT8QMY4_9FIRM|nr:hypothetical protein [Desulfosporosinus nitroreducens]MCO1603291.1 hypothetical protein [Desulfosporosinus nitroreducens]MDO0822698.1 hypothetical protein [Desulfosporosinus nitroreducens]